MEEESPTLNDKQERKEISFIDPKSIFDIRSDMPAYMRLQVQSVLDQIATTPEGQQIFSHVKKSQKIETLGKVPIIRGKENNFTRSKRTVSLNWEDISDEYYDTQRGIGRFSANRLVLHEITHVAFPGATEEEIMSVTNPIMYNYYGEKNRTSYESFDGLSFTTVKFYPKILHNKDKLLTPPQPINDKTTMSRTVQEALTEQTVKAGLQAVENGNDYKNFPYNAQHALEGREP